jgi:hypothetical protein
MAEMHASFQQLAHREVRKRHGHSPVDPPRTSEPSRGSEKATGRL